MKLFRFFLFFFQQPVCFFFLRYDLDTSTGTDEVEVRIYWNTPPFFSLNLFHAFLDKLRKTFPPFFFFFYLQRDFPSIVIARKQKTESFVLHISRSRNFPLFIQVFGQCLNFASFLWKVYVLYI